MAEENGKAGSGGPGNPAGGDPAAGAPTTFTSDTWREAISEEFATDASLADFKSLDDLAKSYVHAQKLIGADDRVRIPKEDDKDNWMKVYNKLGRPAEATGYEFKVPDEAPEGYDNEQFQKYAQDFRKTVHDLGLSKKQAENLWNYQQKTNIDAYGEQITRFKQDLTNLEEQAKKEFGAKLPEVVKLRNNIISQYGGEDVAKFLSENEVLQRSPAILRMFEKIGKALGEDKITKEVKDKPFSPREAKSKLMAMTSDKNHPMYEAYHKKWHPRHDEAVAEVNKLFTYMDS